METGMIARELNLKVMSGADKNNNATGGYTGDLKRRDGQCPRR